ncbi:hypothetical protein HK098_006297, partial [Nowakowskiella sp. JEL0407]
GIPEFEIHSKSHAVPGGGIGQNNEYTIDWNRKRIAFSVNGKVVRTTNRAESFQATVKAPTVQPFNKYWYPETPAQVQFSIWDGGNSPSAGTSNWAGGPTDLTKDIYVQLNWLSIQCYNDKDLPVPEWPVGSRGTYVPTAANAGTVPGGAVNTKLGAIPTAAAVPITVGSGNGVGNTGAQGQATADADSNRISPILIYAVFVLCFLLA